MIIISKGSKIAVIIFEFFILFSIYSSLYSDLGVHLDGNIALVAHSLVLGASSTAPVTGAAADVLAAAFTAAEVAVRLIKPGATNTEVTAAFDKVAEAYGVKAIPGMITHQLNKFILDEGKKIALHADPENKVEDITFSQHEAYAIDVAFTTGEAKPRELDARTTVFKRNPEVNYLLKMKAARTFFGEVSKRFPALPFSIRSIEDETTARLGIKECVEHRLLTPYRVEFEHEGSFVAHVRFTVLLLGGGTQKVTGGELPAFVQSTKVVPNDIQEILKIVPFVSKKGKPKSNAAMDTNN